MKKIRSMLVRLHPLRLLTKNAREESEFEVQLARNLYAYGLIRMEASGGELRPLQLAWMSRHTEEGKKRKGLRDEFRGNESV